jgi:predicted ATPase/DNA-binding XRE family transcriptional regulator
MMASISFGRWIKQRRKALDLTQEQIAKRVGCAEVTIFKIEADERRPSKQIAELLAHHLAIPAADHDAFVTFARSGNIEGALSEAWNTEPASPSNLPFLSTPLIGREQDIAAIRKRLLNESVQLLTLVGPPGIGKTRLSIAAASDVLDAFFDGVFLVLLASVSEAELVPKVIVQTLGIQEVGSQSPLDRLKQHLRDKQMLLVLDNFEQILPAAPDIAELLSACPFLKILVTSRAPLRVRRERQFPVATLTLPDRQQFANVETLAHYSAVALFVDRAQAVQPDFSLTHENGTSVAAICRRLDGLPLAIELISSRIKLLPPAALLDKLHGKLMLASDGLRDLEPRHRTLNAAIGWSYALLDAQEKMLFMRLGVFIGGWTLEAVEAVCQPEISVMDGIASLLDKCLVHQKTGSDEIPRFSMLETIREFALERLTESGEIESIRRQHAQFFLSWASDNNKPMDRIERDYDNLRATLEWWFTNDVGTGAGLAVTMAGYWIQRGQLMEGCFWLEKYVKACEYCAGISAEIVRNLHSTAGALAYFQADLATMRQHAEALLILGKAHPGRLNISVGFFLFGQDALQQYEYERAQDMFTQALEEAQRAGVTHEIASGLLMLSLVAVGQKNYERASSLNAESLALYRQLGDRWGESLILGNDAVIQEALGNLPMGRSLCYQSLQLSYELNDKRTFSQTLEQLAGIIIRSDDDYERAARLMGAAQAVRDSISAVVEPLSQSHRDPIMTEVRAKLDERIFATAWVEGRLMTLEQVIEYALSEQFQIKEKCCHVESFG